MTAASARGLSRRGNRMAQQIDVARVIVEALQERVTKIIVNSSSVTS